MGNTVGSPDARFCDLFTSPERAYILGLWCADGYHRTSSIGISTTDSYILNSFYSFLIDFFKKDRLRIKFYYPLPGSDEWQWIWQNKVGKTECCTSYKARYLAYHLYVNSRPLLRFFQKSRMELDSWHDRFLISAYFAGRFDGDGSIAKDGKSDCRIVYSNEKEALMDRLLLERISIFDSNVYRYKKARTFCLYVYQHQVSHFLAQISSFSFKLQKRASVTP